MSMRMAMSCWVAPVLCVACLACSARSAVAEPPVIKVGSRAELAALSGQVVTVEGYFYDGSIAMLVSDMEYVRADQRMPEDVYVALVGTLPEGLAWGELVRATGIVREPEGNDPPAVLGESIVLAVRAPTDIAKVELP